MEGITVNELIEAVEQELILNGYNNGTLKYYRRCWRKISAYFESRGERCFSYEIAMDYVESVCGKTALDPQQKLSASDVYLYRIVCSLTDFMEKGVILRKYIRRMPYQGTAQSAEILEGFSDYCEKQALADSTQKNFRRTAERLMLYLDSRGILLGSFDALAAGDYIKTLNGYAKKTMEITLCGLRAYMRFLYEKRYIKEPLAERLPRVTVPSKDRIPSVWEPDDLNKLLESIDRSNPTGKRDYALLLLVAKLGLRGVDVKQLTFNCFKWDRKEICFIQSKTGVPIVLPLLPDVGWAVIDYVKNGRPNCESEYVFLRHAAPIGPYTKENHLYATIRKYMKRAGIKREGKKNGLHSLRHTLATSLMERSTPVAEISDILGHTNPDSTTNYLKSSIELLRECAQEVAEDGI